LRRRDKEALEEQLRVARDRAEEESTKERAKYEGKLEESQRRHAAELKLEKERLRIEGEEWKAEVLRRQGENMTEF
jgi:hypothetical protein